MTVEIFDDKRVKEDADKIVKIHNLIEKLFPDKEVLIDCFNNEIHWEVKDKSDKWKSN